MSNKRAEEKQSFITGARRTQIIDATIATLDEIGYVNASLAQIAKRANISTALISYHFRDRQDLMDHTLMALLESSTAYVVERVQGAPTPREKLHTFINASLNYQMQHPKHYVALVEIIFNARTAENVPYYKLNDGEDDPVLGELQRLLRDGQSAGAFRAFNVRVMSTVIQGAIGEYMGNPNLAADIERDAYTADLIQIFDQAILRD